MPTEYTLNLPGERHSRRRVRLKVSADEKPLTEGATVCLDIAETWGHGQRWIELEPGEARQLAVYLVRVADVEEKRLANVQPPKPTAVTEDEIAVIRGNIDEEETA